MKTNTKISDVVAYDETGREFTKTAFLVTSSDMNPIVSFGGFLSYYLETLEQAKFHEAADDEKFYIDGAGSNHAGSPVYIMAKQLAGILKEAQRQLPTHAVDRASRPNESGGESQL